MNNEKKESSLLSNFVSSQITFNKMVHNMSAEELLSLIPIGSYVSWYQYEKLLSGQIISKANNSFQIETASRNGEQSVIRLNPLVFIKNLGAIK